MNNKTLMALTTLVVIGGATLMTPGEVAAQGDDELRPYSALVVQERAYDQRHELTGGVGLLPMDAFTKGVTLSAGYTLHFTDLMAWEVAQFNYSLQFDTRLKGQLEALEIHPSPFEVLDYYLTSNVVFKPLYWKGSWLNDALAQGEFLLTLGGAYGWFTRSTRPGLSAGAGFRLYASELISFRLDLRYLAFPDDRFLDDFSFKDEISIGIGTSLGF